MIKTSKPPNVEEEESAKERLELVRLCVCDETCLVIGEEDAFERYERKTRVVAPPAKRHYSFGRYLHLLQASDQRLEYDHGSIYVLTGSSANHAAICANVWRVLDDAFGELDPCRAYMVDRVVRLATDVTVMPDVVVTCDEADHGEAFFLNSPRLVVEVLSKSLVPLNFSFPVAAIYKRLSIPHEKHTTVSLETIETVDEQEDL